MTDDGEYYELRVPRALVPSRFAPSGESFERRDLDGTYYAVIGRRGWRWHVDVRYPFGPFSPLVERRSFWRIADALAWYDDLTVEAVKQRSADGDGLPGVG